MKIINTNPRKKGPTPGPLTMPYTVILEPLFAEKGKQETGGLSQLLRHMLKEKYKNDII